MYSAFGVDHGYEEVDKAFNPAAIGQKLGQAGGALKKVGSGVAGMFRGGGGAHAAGGFAGAGKRSAGGMPKMFGAQTGGARKAIAAPGGARKMAAGGARKATAAAPATNSTPFYSQMAQKYGINQGGKRKAF